MTHVILLRQHFNTNQVFITRHNNIPKMWKKGRGPVPDLKNTTCRTLAVVLFSMFVNPNFRNSFFSWTLKGEISD